MVGISIVESPATISGVMTGSCVWMMSFVRSIYESTRRYGPFLPFRPPNCNVHGQAPSNIAQSHRIWFGIGLVKIKLKPSRRIPFGKSTNRLSLGPRTVKTATVISRASQTDHLARAQLLIWHCAHPPHHRPGITNSLSPRISSIVLCENSLTSANSSFHLTPPFSFLSGVPVTTCVV